MPEKIDPTLRERTVHLVLEHLQEYHTLTAACEAAARRCGVGRVSVRPAEVDTGDRSGVSTD